MEDPYQTFLTDKTYAGMVVPVRIPWKVAPGIVGMSEPQAAAAGP